MNPQENNLYSFDNVLSKFLETGKSNKCLLINKNYVLVVFQLLYDFI